MRLLLGQDELRLSMSQYTAESSVRRFGERVGEGERVRERWWRGERSICDINK